MGNAHVQRLGPQSRAAVRERLAFAYGQRIIFRERDEWSPAWLALALYRYLLRVRRERVLGRLGILAAVALAGVRTALGFVEVRVALGAVDVAKRARLADVLRQRRRGSPITRLAIHLVGRGDQAAPVWIRRAILRARVGVVGANAVDGGRAG